MSTKEHRLALTDSRLIDGIERVDLRVRDIDDSLRFYRDVVGLVVADKSRHHATLGSPSSPDLLRLESEGVTEASAPDATGLFHIAFRVPDRPSLGDVLARISDAGIRIGAADHLVSEALYIDDPDGNGIEIYRDLPEEQWPAPDGQSIVPMASNQLGMQSIFSAGRQTEAIGASCHDHTDIGHVHLQVSNIDAADQFFDHTLGLDLIQSLGDSARFYSSNGYHHHIGANTWQSRDSGPPASTQAGLSQVVINATCVDELRALQKRLKASDFQVTGDASQALTVDDPDQTTLQFVA